jgi:hypothetical protein
VVVNSMLNYQLSAALRADEIRRARRHPIAEVPPAERRAPRRMPRLFAPLPRVGLQVSRSTA